MVSTLKACLFAVFAFLFSMLPYCPKSSFPFVLVCLPFVLFSRPCSLSTRLTHFTLCLRAVLLCPFLLCTYTQTYIICVLPHSTYLFYFLFLSFFLGTRVGKSVTVARGFQCARVRSTSFTACTSLAASPVPLTLLRNEVTLYRSATSRALHPFRALVGCSPTHALVLVNS